MHSVSRTTAALLSCLLAGVTFPALAHADGPANRTAPHATQSIDRIKADLDTVFGFLSPIGAGCVAGVTSGGSSLTVAYGQADLEHAAPLSPESVFESGSLAKQFTGAAMLLLVQDGKLTLDDDIRTYLPEMPDYGTPITIRHLLNHTSGLREQWSLLALIGAPPGTQIHDQTTILDLASRQRGLNFTPGTEFLYTNTNYTLAAIIIARVSGQTLQAFTHERLFQPLGMSQTRWREDFRTVVPGRAMAYAQTETGFIANMPFTNVIGNGGLLTTASDLLRWNAFLDHPSALPDGMALVTALQTPGHLSDGTPLDYALGLEVSPRQGQTLASHSGSTGGYKSWIGRYPERDISVVVLCNNGGVDPVALGQAVIDQELRAAGYPLTDLAPAPAPLPIAPLPSGSAMANGEALSAYVGSYYSSELDTRITVARDGDRLVMRQPFAIEWPLTPTVADSFTTRLRGTTTFRFTRAADGQIIGFGAWMNGARGVPFAKE